MTVSRVLRGAPKVSAETRARVQAEATRLNYQPDPHFARLMQVVRDRHDPFARRQHGGIVHAEGERGLIKTYTELRTEGRWRGVGILADPRMHIMHRRVPCCRD